MDRAEKIEKRKIIGEEIDLSGGRYKDSEINQLFDVVSNIADYSQKTVIQERSHDGWSSDGKYTRKEKNSYSLIKDEDGIYVHEKYSYEDDDGQTGGYEKRYSTGRAILNMLSIFHKDK